MKRLGALTLAFFVLLLSIESSIGMHFCHNTLVETSINSQLSSCCKEASKHEQPVFTKQCCEITHFSVDFDDTLVSQLDIELTHLVTFLPLFQFDAFSVDSTPKQQVIQPIPPPESSHIPLHILLEQYLI